MHGTLLDVVARSAERSPNRGYKFLADGTTESASLSYSALARECRAIAARMQDLNVREGARALLLYGPGLQFIPAFWGCIHAGVAAVPAPTPHPARPRRTLARLRAIAADCAPEIILTDGSFSEDMARTWLHGQDTALFDTTVPGDDYSDSWHAPLIDGDSTAAIQYTSGSTGDPRGVVVSHANFLHNLKMLAAFQREPEDLVMVQWLPLFHDMGLIRGMMSPLHLGGDCVMMPPMQFVQRPLRWLLAASRYRATSIGAPNFGYELCNRKISDAEIEALNLTSIRVAFCSAEPIRSSTVRRFVERFGRCGFRRSAFLPSYGLAEATVMVCGEMSDEGPCVRYAYRHALRAGSFVAADESDAGAVGIVSCGTPLGGQQLVVVNPAGARAAAGEVGEIWIRGPSVARGYWNNAAASAAVFGGYLPDGSGPFLRTGDLGCIGAAGEIFVTGRKKDLIVVRGQNYYPTDIESAVECAVPEIRAGCAAAFSVEDDLGESVAIVCEPAAPWIPSARAWNAMVGSIRAVVSESFELRLSAIALVRRGTLPKTASGKLQRSGARAGFLDGTLDVAREWRARASAPDRSPRRHETLSRSPAKTARCSAIRRERRACHRPSSHHRPR